MSGARGVLCTLGLTVVLAAGCTSADAFNALLLQGDAKGGDRVLGASVDSVSESVAASLSQLGMAAKVSRRGDAVIIASSTQTGTHFTFVLTREKTRDSEQTRVHVDWEKSGEEEMGLEILNQAETQARVNARNK